MVDRLKIKEARDAGVTTRGAESANTSYAMGGAWIATMSVWRQVERWENEGGGQGARSDFGHSDGDLEVVKDHRTKRSQILADYAKTGELDTE